jgi:ribose-phosphate pyrophosphokinase
MSSLIIFSGSNSDELTKKICGHLGVSQGKIKIKRFNDGEIHVKILENVRRADVFVVQSVCSPKINDYLVELLIIIQTLKYASAERIATVLPYYPYSRQDRKVDARTPITARLIADLIIAAGAHTSISMDLHSGQIQGFFSIPNDNMFARPIFVEEIKRLQATLGKEIVFVSPDAGGAARTREYAEKFKCPYILIDKRRPKDKDNFSEVMNVVGDPPIGKVAIIIDDMVDTAGTLVKAADALVEKGATRVFAFATHAVLSKNAVQKIEDSKIETMYITDTIPLRKKSDKFRIITASHILAETIKAGHHGFGVSHLFK